MTLPPKVLSRLDDVQDRYEEVAHMLAEPETVADRQRFTSLSREYSEIEPIVLAYTRYREIQNELEDALALQQEADPEMKELVTDTIDELQPQVIEQSEMIQRLLLPKDPDDEANVFLEIRAGTGGEEAALFVADLMRMYICYADSKNWVAKITDKSPTGIGGFKQVSIWIEGRDVYSQLKFESGTHRVQRIPKTESQGRIHTSACTVAVLPDHPDEDDVVIDKSDLRIDTFRASGAGGQHVNKKDSAVRITHIPSGTVVESQQERSQLRNRQHAMSHLVAKLMADEKAKRIEEEASDRKLQVGSGDRSQRIRTYNFPQGRVTDHRISLTLYKLDEILEGSLDLIVEPLVLDHQTDLLHELQADTVA